MPTLWTFGDSFTRGHGMNGEIPEYKNADKNLKWNNLLANQLEYDLKNFGDNGLPNETILETIIQNLNQFKKDDVLIIESSTLGRMVVPEKDSKHEYANVNPVFIHQNTILDEPYVYLKHFQQYELDSIISFFNNFILDGFYYTNQIKSIINLAKYLNDNKIVRKVIYWNLFPIESVEGFTIKSIYENRAELDSVYLKNYIGSDTYKYGWINYFKRQNMTIFSDTNGEINDFHLSKHGHNIFFRLLLSELGLETKHNYVI